MAVEQHQRVTGLSGSGSWWEKSVKALGGNGVPLIIIGANKMSGFSQEMLEYYLDGGK